eukprot:g4047.t1
MDLSPHSVHEAPAQLPGLSATVAAPLMHSPAGNPGGGRASSGKSHRVPPFVEKLFRIFTAASADTAGAMGCRWDRPGMRLIIYDAQKFVKNTLPHYFKHRNINSFVRQLNMYDFHKVGHDAEEPDNGEFAHKHFRRGRRDLLVHIQRKRKARPNTVDQMAAAMLNGSRSKRRRGGDDGAQASPSVQALVGVCAHHVNELMVLQQQLLAVGSAKLRGGRKEAQVACIRTVTCDLARTLNESLLRFSNNVQQAHRLVSMAEMTASLGLAAGAGAGAGVGAGAGMSAGLGVAGLQSLLFQRPAQDSAVGAAWAGLAAGGAAVSTGGKAPSASPGACEHSKPGASNDAGPGLSVGAAEQAPASMGGNASEQAPQAQTPTRAQAETLRLAQALQLQEAQNTQRVLGQLQLQARVQAQAGQLQLQASVQAHAHAHAQAQAHAKALHQATRGMQQQQALAQFQAEAHTQTQGQSQHSHPQVQPPGGVQQQLMALASQLKH